jgi:hypothetical protein
MIGLDQYFIAREGFENIRYGDEVIGYKIEMELPFYRALPLSCFEQFLLKVDGELVEERVMELCLRGTHFRMDEVPWLESEWWSVDTRPSLIVNQEGGLDPGEHQVELYARFRWELLKPESMDPDQGPLYENSFDSKTLVMK